MALNDSNNPKIKVLMIDDDEKLCRLVKDYLSLRGFEIEASHSGAQGLEAIMKKNFQAIILDVMLPGIDGFEILKKIRAISNVPVLMLTALADEPDRILGLEMGADDYLPKTFSIRELLARLRAVTRRSTLIEHNPKAAESTLNVGHFSLDRAARKATFKNEVLSLTTLEFDLLFSLARSAGHVLSRDKLLDEIAGRDYEVFDRSIDVHVSSLRRKIGDDAKNPRFIKTFRSVGYMLTGELKD